MSSWQNLLSVPGQSRQVSTESVPDYLQRSRYSEAVALNEQLDSRPDSRGRNATRKAIMQRYSRANLFQVGM